MKLHYYWLCIVLMISACNTLNSTQKKATFKENNTLFFSKNDYKNNKTTSVVNTQNFTLHKDKFLSIHFTLKQPLIKSLQELAPNLSQEQLLNQGNFQFTFLVDDKIVHTENLNKGARPFLLKQPNLAIQYQWYTLHKLIFGVGLCG